MAWLDDNETLRDRIGEVRYGAQDGGWVRVDAQQDRFRHGFKQESHGVMVGYDRLTERNENSVWLLGGAFPKSRRKTPRNPVGSRSFKLKVRETHGLFY